ncbi:MAG TPA: family 78 glycoside hydrolase catalytic domain, partial [Verrucomicrobiae bacterium]
MQLPRTPTPDGTPAPSQSSKAPEPISQGIFAPGLLAPLAAALVLMLSGRQTPAEVTGMEFGPADLTCEHVRDPLGVDRGAPRLSWKLQGTARGLSQTAYRILVASSGDLLNRDKGDLWDSGKVKSDQTTHIPYGGKPLSASRQVFWKVRSWNQAGKSSTWSASGHWTMGLLAEADWHARWIAAVARTTGTSGPKQEPQTLLLRRDFKVKPQLRRALAHVCGLGCYELTINGVKTGDALFPPGWTKYDKTCLYDTYDITGLLRPEGNAVGLLLGNGMYNVVGGRYTKFTGSFGPLKAIAQLRLEYQNGTVEIIGSDDRWQTHSGPITFSCVFGGEDYDARLEPLGWNQPGFSGNDWKPAIEVDGPGGRLKGLSCAAPPIRAFEVLEPISAKPQRPGVTIYDLGQNVSLMPRIKVRGAAGDVIRIKPAELITATGALDRGSCGGGEAYWQYTLSGRGEETWFPKFFYHGCRYLEAECRAGSGGQAPSLGAIEGVVVHSASEPVGSFECSNDLFNRVHRLVRWAQRSNMMSVMTDCPHREKLGWLEEDHLNGPSLRYEFDLAQLFTKMMNDMADSQLENGLVPDIAPEYVKFDGGFRDSPEWGSALLLVAWQQYEFTGDLELLRRYYDGMKRYVAYLGSRSKDHIVSHGLGDWYDIGPKPPGVAQLTPVPLTATAFYYYDSWVLAQTARLLGRADDATRYSELAAAVKDAFNKRFYDAEAGRYATGSQCANAIPLVMDLADPAHRASVLESVVTDVRARGNALTAGDVGYRYLLRALAEGNRSDLIFDINNQSQKPG